MNTYFLTILFALLFSWNICAQSIIQIGETKVQVDTIASGLDVPWEVQYHRNELWFTERLGRISKLDLASMQKSTILDIQDQVFQRFESGLLGLVLHPAFDLNKKLYTVYTYEAGRDIKERIVEYTFDGSALTNPTIILDEIPGNTTHIGCRLLFLPDTTLLATTGDAQEQQLPLNLNSLSGKVLRMHTDGSIPEDNPFPNSLVYSYGHRNAQGMAFLPNGSILMSEHGPSTDDEVHLLNSGGNYGWPEVHGFCDEADEMDYCSNNSIVEPLVAFTPTIAPSDLIFYQNDNFPEWNNKVLMTVLKDKEIRAFTLNQDYTEIVNQETFLEDNFGRLRDIEVAPNGDIFIATNGSSWSNSDPGTHSIIRLRPIGSSSAPVETNSSQLELYPNPFDSVVNVSSDKDIKEIQVRNAKGILVKTSNQLPLILNDVPSGVYFFEIEFIDGSIELAKAIKQ